MGPPQVAVNVFGRFHEEFASVQPFPLLIYSAFSRTTPCCVWTITLCTRSGKPSPLKSINCDSIGPPQVATNVLGRFQEALAGVQPLPVLMYSAFSRTTPCCVWTITLCTKSG